MILDALTKKYTGRIKLAGVAWGAIGDKYTSKRIKFDLKPSSAA